MSCQMLRFPPLTCNQSFIQTWTLSPFASLTTLPQAVAFQYEPLNSTVYFAEAYASQLRTDGIALGTYDYNHSTPLDEGVRQPASNATFLEGGTRVNGNKDASDAAEGALVQSVMLAVFCEVN